ncbi:hypothetical protein HanRHA438_Chr03g0107831 [Helianthus annuus]|nr:hypothetical protein HanRHA438_Chr03g0107831 [Helianthus annuus]
MPAMLPKLTYITDLGALVSSQEKKVLSCSKMMPEVEVDDGKYFGSGPKVNLGIGKAWLRVFNIASSGSLKEFQIIPDDAFTCFITLV